jgi:hypothetical protein
MKASVRRNGLRALLVLHFIGLGMSVGARFADLVIESMTRTGGLQLLVLGRDLTGEVARSLVLPGFLLLIATGIAMTLLRYGWRPPVWVWMKVGIVSTVLLVANPLVAPAARAARYWAHWSLDHHQLAPQFQAAAARASLFGGIVVALFLLNVPISVWKPFLAVNLYRRRAPANPVLP